MPASTFSGCCMVQWLVEFEGKQKPLDEIKSQDFQRSVEPIRTFLSDVLAPILNEPELGELRVIFSLDPETGLKFTLRGPPALVNEAISRIGPNAEIAKRMQ